MKAIGVVLLAVVFCASCDDSDSCAKVEVEQCGQHADHALYYPDLDQDGFGDEAAAACLCAPDKNHPVSLGGDCDDTDRMVHPDRVELCNRIDDDCDGETDEDFADLGEPCDGPDSDSCLNGIRICAADGEGTTCSPEDPSNLQELCNGLDDDCDGETDEDFALGEACDGPDADECANGLWICSSDELGVICGPEDPENIVEICNGMDDDCDGETDEGFGDTDGDGVANCVDNCPLDANPDQADTDGDGVGDVCQQGFVDADQDGVEDGQDNCVHVPNSLQEDGDDDGVGDVCDNCPAVANPDQADQDRVEVSFVHEPGSLEEDCVDPEWVCLWRDVTGPVINTAAGTMEWACGDCTAPGSAFFPSHSDLKNECFAGYLPDTVGQTTCLRVVETNALWNVTWTSFQSGGGGGFGYVRVSFDGGDACD